MLPAVGQGAVAVEIKTGNTDAAEVVSKLDHEATRICVTAERAFLRTLEGGCQVPIGANAQLEGSSLRLDGLVGSLDGKIIFREGMEGRGQDAERLGIGLAESLIERGARELLEETRVKAKGSSDAVV